MSLCESFYASRSPATTRAACALRRAAVLRCSAPRAAALSSQLTSEVDKLSTWAKADTPITVRDVQQLAAGRAETAIFAVTDAWGRRDVGATLRSAEELMERSHRPRSGELMRIAAVGAEVDVLPQLRALSAAVAAPQLGAMCAVIGGEEHGVAEPGEVGEDREAVALRVDVLEASRAAGRAVGGP